MGTDGGHVATEPATLQTLARLIATDGDLDGLRDYFGNDPVLIVSADGHGENLMRVDTPSAGTETRSWESEEALKSTQAVVVSPFAGIAKPENLAVRVHKSDRNPFEGWITVGRAGNNDLIISSSRVSKLHLIVTPGPDGSWTIHDNATTNGTQLNGVLLPPRETRPLQFGDNLWIGGVSSLFVDQAGLAAICYQLA
jgi:hypothetical protein